MDDGRKLTITPRGPRPWKAPLVYPRNVALWIRRPGEIPLIAASQIPTMRRGSMRRGWPEEARLIGAFMIL